MFLVGGTPFSGTTLLAHLLNQGDVVCLDEPDFHDSRQRHRGIPFLSRLFPDKAFPTQPERDLTYPEAVAVIERCEELIRPSTLGMKTAAWVFLEYAKIYRASGYPVIAVVRDIRDVLAGAPLPEWVGGEPGLNRAFRSIWMNLDLCDFWIRYEDLVTKPEEVFESLSTLLARDLEPVREWSAESVHDTMFKLDRHEMLRIGRISRTRVGIWKGSGRAFSDDTRMTAAMMGYSET
ncbi:MAG: sulfotransferase [Gemmatimonadota bacterium]|nr:sulfotransferase [Gemmatimonadota bacterium]